MKKKIDEILKSVPVKERDLILQRLRPVVEPAEEFEIDMTKQPRNKAIVVEVDGKEMTLPPKEAMTLLRSGKARLVKVIHY